MSTATKPKHIGRNISRIRELRGMKQEALAIAIGVSQQSVSSIEASETVDEEKLVEVAKALGVSVEAIKRKILSTINSYYGLFIHSKSYTLRKKLFFSMGRVGDNIIPSNMNFTKFCCFKK